LIRTWLERSPLAVALWPISVLYGVLIGLRRMAYRSGLRRSERLSRPVLVVGNRIVGGAGKTPTVIALLAHLRAAGWRPGVISRGHGAADRPNTIEVHPDTPVASAGDEPLLIRLRSGVPVVVGADRVAAGRTLLAMHPEIDLVVTDDGLQHLRLARDVEVVVFDARGAGNGWLLPAGPLREPIEVASVAASTLVLYNASKPSTPLPGACAEARLAGAVELSAWWRGEPAHSETLWALRQQPLRACAGVAQPSRFFAQLRQAGLEVEELAHSDHASYESLPWPTGDRNVIVTEKDAVKLEPARVARERPDCRVWVAPLDFRVDPAFLAALDAALAPHAGVATRKE
jgi:tetraacyldisaccharide 4'-kinase